MEQAELLTMQKAYRSAVDEWIADYKGRGRTRLCRAHVAQVDEWEAAHFKEDELEIGEEGKEGLRGRDSAKPVQVLMTRE